MRSQPETDGPGLRRTGLTAPVSREMAALPDDAISEADYLAGLRAAGLEDVEVRGRLVYDASQLASFAASATEGVCSCGSQLPAELV
jgi:hypothetical protein